MTTYHYCLVYLMVKYLGWIRVLVINFHNMICRMEPFLFKLRQDDCLDFNLMRVCVVCMRVKRHNGKSSQIKYLASFLCTRTQQIAYIKKEKNQTEMKNRREME